MNILLCDDIPREAEKLSGFLHEFGYEPMAFTKGADLLAYVHTGAAADVCILDIVMPDMSGIELAQKLRQAGFGGEIVFLSASNEYGPQTYDVKAFHYLVKPITPERLKLVLDEIRAVRDRSDTDGIRLKASGAVRYLLFRDIEYAEVVRHYVGFRLVNGETLEVRAPFTEIAPQLLIDKRFIQCHQSYIVNMDAIASITSREIITGSGARVPVSKSYPHTKMKYLDRGLRGEQD